MQSAALTPSGWHLNSLPILQYSKFTTWQQLELEKSPLEMQGKYKYYLIVHIVYAYLVVVWNPIYTLNPFKRLASSNTDHSSKLLVIVVIQSEYGNNISVLE
jgi:hypothetical protein